jgi:hypothetical protein
MINREKVQIETAHIAAGRRPPQGIGRMWTGSMQSE